MLVTECHLHCGNWNVQILVPVEASKVYIQHIYMYISALQFQREEQEFLVFLLRPHTSRPHSPAAGRGHLRLQLTVAHGAQQCQAPRLTRTRPGSPTPAPSHPPQHGLELDTSHLSKQGTQSPRSPFHPGSPPTSQPPVDLPVSFSELRDGVWIRKNLTASPSPSSMGLIWPQRCVRAVAGVVGRIYKQWWFCSLVLCICSCWCLTKKLLAVGHIYYLPGLGR